MNTTAPSDTLPPGTRVAYYGVHGTVLTRGEAIRANVHLARYADMQVDVPVRFDDGQLFWYRPTELDVLERPPATPIDDDMRVTVDHLAGRATGRPVVTIKFTAPRELFDVPIEQWRGIAVDEVARRAAHARQRAE